MSHPTRRRRSHASFGRSHPRLDVHHKLGIIGFLFLVVLVLLLVVLVVLVLLLVYVASLPPGGLTAAPGRPAPAFALPLLGSGNQYGTPELKGKLVIVTVWASWCEPCSIEARLLEDVWRRYRDRGLVALGVNLDAVESDALAFVRRHGVTYPNVQDVGTVGGAFGLAGMPETYFLEENWTVNSVYRGYEREVDRSHGVVLQDALYQPILERRVEALSPAVLVPERGTGMRARSNKTEPPRPPRQTNDGLQSAIEESTSARPCTPILIPRGRRRQGPWELTGRSRGRRARPGKTGMCRSRSSTAHVLHAPTQTEHPVAGRTLHKIRVRKEDLDAYLERARIEPGAPRHLYPDTDGPDKEAGTEWP